MRRYLVTRLLLMPLNLWAAVTVLFILLRVVPGDPVDVILGSRASAEVRAQMRLQMGLQGSLLEQYGRYLSSLLRLDLGTAYNGQSVKQIIATHFPATLELAIAALIIALTVAIPFGIWAALKPDRPSSTAIRSFSILTYAMPLSWLGMVLQLGFGVYLNWLPLGGRLPVGMVPPATLTGLYSLDALLQGEWDILWQSLRYLCLPALTLGLVTGGVFTRMIRTNVGAVLDQPYITAATARGLKRWRVVLLHALRNALVPVLTIIGLAIAALMGGALLTEITFSWPGLASRLVQAISQRDYPVIQGLTSFFAAIVILVSVSLDLFNAWVDPRIRY